MPTYNVTEIYNGRTTERDIDGITTTVTYSGTKADCEGYASTLAIGASYSGLGVLKSYTITQYGGAIYNIAVKYQNANGQSGTTPVTPPDYAFGQKSGSLDGTMLSTPLEIHKNASGRRHDSGGSSMVEYTWRGLFDRGTRSYPVRRPGDVSMDRKRRSAAGDGLHLGSAETADDAGIPVLRPRAVHLDGIGTIQRFADRAFSRFLTGEQARHAVLSSFRHAVRRGELEMRPRDRRIYWRVLESHANLDVFAGRLELDALSGEFVR